MNVHYVGDQMLLFTFLCRKVAYLRSTWHHYHRLPVLSDLVR